MESPIRLYQKQKDYQRHKLFRKIKRRRERERKNAINAPIKELRRRMKQPVRFRGGKDQHKGEKYGYDVEYMSEAEAMKQLADNMNRTAVMDEVVVTPYRKIPMQAELSEGITNQAANERADAYANATAPTAMDIFNIGTLGGLNNLSPAQQVRRAYDLVQAINGNMSWDKFGNDWFYGNNGLVSDEYAKEHPYASAAINLAGDIGSFGTFSALRKLPKYAAMMEAENRAAQEAAVLNWKNMLANSVRRTRLGDVEINNPNIAYRQGNDLGRTYQKYKDIDASVAQHQIEDNLVQSISLKDGKPYISREKALDKAIASGTYDPVVGIEVDGHSVAFRDTPMYSNGFLWYGAPKIDKSLPPGSLQSGLLITPRNDAFIIGSNKATPYKGLGSGVIRSKSGVTTVTDNGGRLIPADTDNLGLELNNISAYTWEPGYGYRRVFTEETPTIEWADAARTPKITADNAASITPEQWTAAQDAAYKNAVMSGNRKKALELLDEAYKRSGVPETIVTTDASGRPKIWYTGSEYGNHTVFDSSKFNATIGGESAVGKIKGNFLTTDLPSAARYAGSGVGEVHEFTEPSTFLEKFQNIFGKYRPERIHPTDRIPEILRPKPDRLFTIKDAPVVDYLDETDKVVYPMYVNPGERVYTVDFKGNPWSRSPIKFPNSFSIKKTIRDDIAKTYRDEIVPFKDRETAVEYYKSLEDRFGKMYVEDPSKLNDKYFPYPGGDRSVEMFASAPTYEKASLIETHTPATTNGAVQTAAREGYTSVYMPNVIDSNVRSGVPYAIDDFVTLDSRQMKMADITYDDAGNLIPLSERFNWNNPDIRYGLLPIVGMGALKALDKDGQIGFIDFNIGYQKGKDKHLQPPKFQKGTDDNRVQITERTYPDGCPDFYKNVKEALKYVPATIGLTVAADSYNRGKDIYIKPSKRGTFTAAAKKRRMSVQQFASKVLKAPKGKYSTSMRKKANFAKNASKWKK